MKESADADKSTLSPPKTTGKRKPDPKLAEALRANLLRRKAAAKAQKDGSA